MFQDRALCASPETNPMSRTQHLNDAWRSAALRRLGLYRGSSTHVDERHRPMLNYDSFGGESNPAGWPVAERLRDMTNNHDA